MQKIYTKISNTQKQNNGLLFYSELYTLHILNFISIKNLLQFWCKLCINPKVIKKKIFVKLIMDHPVYA